MNCLLMSTLQYSADIKTLLNNKKTVFRMGNREDMRCAQEQLKCSIREVKEDYRRKMKLKLWQNNGREAWSGMKRITGSKQNNGQMTEGNVERARSFSTSLTQWLLSPYPPTPQMLAPNPSHCPLPGLL